MGIGEMVELVELVELGNWGIGELGELGEGNSQIITSLKWKPMEDARKGYEDLEVWKLAMEIGRKVYFAVAKWDNFNKFKHGQQWLGAADSIAANIAEGYGRYFYSENRNFCFYSRGSLYESKTWLIKANERVIIVSELYTELYNLHEILAKKLNNYINYIESEMTKNPKRAKPN